MKLDIIALIPLCNISKDGIFFKKIIYHLCIQTHVIVRLHYFTFSNFVS